jgi:hypothetical protein
MQNQGRIIQWHDVKGVYITYTDWKSPTVGGLYNPDAQPYRYSKRDRFIHKSDKLIYAAPSAPPPRPLPLPRFNPTVKDDHYAGGNYWISSDKKQCVSWHKNAIYVDGVCYVVAGNRYTADSNAIIAASLISKEDALIAMREDGTKLIFCKYNLKTGARTELYSQSLAITNTLPLGRFTNDDGGYGLLMYVLFNNRAWSVQSFAVYTFDKTTFDITTTELIKDDDYIGIPSAIFNDGDLISVGTIEYDGNQTETENYEWQGDENQTGTGITTKIISTNWNSKYRIYHFKGSKLEEQKSQELQQNNTLVSTTVTERDYINGVYVTQRDSYYSQATYRDYMILFAGVNLMVYLTVNRDEDTRTIGGIASGTRKASGSIDIVKINGDATIVEYSKPIIPYFGLTSSLVTSNHQATILNGAFLNDFMAFSYPTMPDSTFDAGANYPIYDGETIMYNAKTGEVQVFDYRIDYDTSNRYYPLSVTAL